MRIDVADLPASVGQSLGYSRWFEIGQSRIDGFADVTEDRQWIHVDPARAADGPFGVTIAHGYLLLSLLSAVLEELLEVTGIAMGINYGLDRIRFPAPVPVGSRVRGAGSIVAVERISSGVRVRLSLTIEIEDEAKPACVAEKLALYVPAESADSASCPE